MFENPINYLGNPFGYYIVDVMDRNGTRIGRMRAKGPLASAEGFIRRKMRKAGFTRVTLRAHIAAYVG